LDAERNLEKLITTMRPELQEGEFVFCTVSAEMDERSDIQPVGWFREAEGITLIVEREIAERAGLAYTYISRMITLSVHSNLEAVGFLAVITKVLAKAGISVNPVSAYYHDHLFVPVDKAQMALEKLETLTIEYGQES
jgi:hypothetical protein